MYVVLYTPYFIKADLTSMSEDFSASLCFCTNVFFISQLSFYLIFDRIVQSEGEIKGKFCIGTYFYLDFQKSRVSSSREPENKTTLALTQYVHMPL